ncbi:MAG: GNAT family N-acetyltransferase [Okeania sp. SIO2G4]|uniref:GNAT family N-acetyltransferase n=1 Tax=unclassified Okeania TaxID=2634635 RepID=UPI0013BB5455|nr:MULTISPECIES: GNAT family N-acetyltransferase [unclassified Okeania]NEP06202.1 GNAT family N-acetyltransferase [Okeania sp. SIO4D6]NEP39870.1 GNAT family N-acetyltransferase [Okeania sp. SIO2H7]NEP71044.1 GNAT family N-acetyltransferase [Okeania sp. SIO2G5]NEP91536.1 GNAT family N-acetyltransferase [Okeania sp. SIO2F5]NEQ89412.1 GNAT family N-acetyltransferase [Okeania sp. SIO2G4]
MKIFLETERLVLRQFTEADTELLFELDSDPEVTRYTKLGDRSGTPTTYDEIKNKFLPKVFRYYQQYQSYGFWAAIEKLSNKFIGWFHFRPGLDSYMGAALYQENDIELGYRLQRKVWGKGYATEGSKALISKGFLEWEIQQVAASALLENKASIRVMEKVGLKFERNFVYSESQQKVIKYSLSQDYFYLLEKPRVKKE